MSTTKTAPHDVQAAINEAEQAVDPIGRDEKPVAISNRNLQILIEAAKNRPEDKTDEFRKAIEDAMDTLRHALSD